MSSAVTADNMPTDQVAKSSAPGKIVGFSFVGQSLLYDSIKVLSIVPGKYIASSIAEIASASRDALGNHLADAAVSIFKVSMKTEDILVGLAARCLGFYTMKTYSPYGHPLQAMETLTGSKTFLRTPEQNLKEGHMGEYAAQRLMYTASTNTVAATGVIVTKLVLGMMAMPATFPALCAAFAATYTGILTARVIADVLQDAAGVSQLDPNRKVLIDSLADAREKASHKGKHV